jgi:hypothetical protein
VSTQKLSLSSEYRALPEQAGALGSFSKLSNLGQIRTSGEHHNDRNFRLGRLAI